MGWSRWLAFGLVGAFLILAFAEVFDLYARYFWAPEPLYGVYTMAPLISLAALYLFWRRRRLFVASEGPYLNPVLAYGILIVGVLLKLNAEFEGYALLRGGALIPILLGIVAILLPRASVRGLLFPICYLGFIIPLPPFVLDQLTHPLLNGAVWVADHTLVWSGLNYLRMGNTFMVSIPGGLVHEIQMVDACSGIRSLFPLVALICFYVNLRDISLFRKAGLVLFAIPLAIFGNISRVVLTIVLIVAVGPEAGASFFHEFSGLFAFIAALCGVFVLEGFLTLRKRVTSND